MVSKIKDHQEPARSIKEILERSGLSEQLKNIGQINEALTVAFNPIIDQIRETMPQAPIIERLKELGVEPYTSPEMEAFRNQVASISAAWSHSHQILMNSTGLHEVISAFNQQKIIIDFSFLDFSQLKNAIDWEAVKEWQELQGEELDDISDFDEEMTQFMERSYPTEDFRSQESWWQALPPEWKIAVISWVIALFIAFGNYYQSEQHHQEQLEQGKQHHREQLEASRSDQKELTDALNKHSESLDRNSELLLRQEKSRDIQQNGGQVKQTDRTPPQDQSNTSEDKPVIVEKPNGD